MKVVLENKEELHVMEERIKKAVDCVLESNSKLRSSERKLIRSQLTRLTSCLTLKIKRNTRLRDEEWSDVEEDAREAKVAKNEQIEPEDMVLKARVENLRKQVKETAARVHAHRTRVPAEMRQQTHKSIQQARSALESSLASSTSEQHALPATPLTVSEPVAQAFVHDTLDLARRAAHLSKSLPQQVTQGKAAVKLYLEVTKGKAAIKVCAAWSRKPLSTAETLLAQRDAPPPDKSPGRRRKGAAVEALRERQPQ